MKKYFFKNDEGQQGPFTLDELKDKGITPETPVWHEGLDNWTTAAQAEDLKELITPPEQVVEKAAIVLEEKIEATEESTVAAVVNETKETVAEVTASATTTPETPVIKVPVADMATTPAASVAAPVLKAVRKKGSPVVTWALSLAVIGGTGYYVYQDMEKNKNNSSVDLVSSDTTTVNTNNTISLQDASSTSQNDTAASGNITSEADTVKTSLPPTDPGTATLTTNTEDPKATAKKEEDRKKIDASIAKKKEEEKKKLLAAEAKKKEEAKKKLLAAQALVAKEMEMRNNWPRYITIGSYKTEGDDKVKPFSIPVYNSFPADAEKITLRVDYIKKEKIVGTETIVVSNVPAKGGATAQAAGNKKGKTANVYITGVTSRQLHFCYPSTGGKTGDQYYCN